MDLLAGLEPAKIPQIVQTLFVCTGCDYISFFSGVGKATFLRYIFSTVYGATAEGSLADIQLTTGNFKRGFLAFLQLVGTAYYKKHTSALQFPSPNTHFLQFSGSTPLVYHIQWIDDVRQNIADRSTFENDMILRQMHSFFIGRDHAGYSTCGHSLRTIPWILNPSQNTVGTYRTISSKSHGTLKKI